MNNFILMKQSNSYNKEKVINDVKSKILDSNFFNLYKLFNDLIKSISKQNYVLLINLEKN